MNRNHLIQEMIKKHPEMTNSNVKKLVEVFFEKIIQGVMDRGRVELRGFGSFQVIKRNPRASRNPKTGVITQTESRYALHFKPGKDTVKSLNKASPTGFEPVLSP